MKALVPWLIAGGLLVSFTASAGIRTDGFDQPQARSLLDSPIALAPSVQAQGLSTLWDAPLADVAQWLTGPAAPSRGRAQSLMFMDQPALLPPTALSEAGAFAERTLAGAGRFLARNLDGVTTADARGVTAPNASASGSSPALLASLTAASPSGATPGVPRAVSLASSTPAPVEPQIVAMPPGQTAAVASLNPRATTPERKPASFPGYADLIDPEAMSREQRCLAEAVYFEARSEPPEGQAAVAQVVLNRVKSGLYPDTVCGVVYQNRHRYKACQFSFSCEGKSLRITEPGPWKQAVKIAREVTFGQTYLPAVGASTHYHADYVRPHWSRVFRKTDSIGRHIFYRPRPGQS